MELPDRLAATPRATARAERRRRVAAAGALVVAMAAALTLGGPSRGATAAAANRSVVMYAVTTHAQFLNEADDIARGNGTNPFNIDVKTIPSKPNGKGELPGDSAYFSFAVYSDSSLKTQVGSGSYACRYGFDQQAICQAYFSVHGGSLSASGPVDFTDSVFTLPVTGGTGSYLGAGGEVIARRPTQAAAKNETVLDFVFVQ